MSSVIETGILSEGQLKLAVDELSDGDTVATARLSQLLAGEVGLEELPFAGHEPVRSLDLLAHSLHRAGRIADLDWAVGYTPALEELARLFAKASIAVPDGIADRLAALEPDMERGDPVGYVFVLLDPIARAAGYEILDLNHGGDSFWMFLARSDASARWRNVVLGDGVRIESPEWQFADVLGRLGLAARYPGHPRHSIQAPPEAP